MAEHTDLKSLSIEMIDEYLDAARLLLSTPKADRGIHGYSATLLMMAVVDSLGHAQSGRSKGFDRSALKGAPFSLGDTFCEQLENWYRHGLVHTGTLAPNVYVYPESSGDPFMFDPDGKLNGIRAPVLLSMIENLWADRKPAHEPVPMNPNAAARAPKPSRRCATSATRPLSGGSFPVSGMAGPEVPKAK